MPDLQSALSQALQEWDKDITHSQKVTTMETKTTEKKKPLFPVTTNVTRRTFQFVKDNPGVRHSHIMMWAKTENLNPDSAVAVAAACARQGQMRKDERGGFHAIVPEYQPIKNGGKPIAKKTKKNSGTMSPKKEQFVPSDVPSVPKEQPKPPATPILPMTATNIINNINVHEAKALWLALNEIFESK
jgi:hypothetical protein